MVSDDFEDFVFDAGAVFVDVDGTAAVMELAHTVIDELDLGQRRERDYLAISLSATDRVGHAFGRYAAGKARA